jgi:DNA-binding XRE family transcriptional regulator
MPKEASKRATTLRELKAARVLFAGKVRAARAVLGWSQTELANKTGLTQRAIYKIEQAAVDARLSTVTAVSAAFIKAGIVFEDMQDGGFRIIIPPRALRSPAERTGKRSGSS